MSNENDGDGPQIAGAIILNIEGREIPWDKPTITTEEIANLGGWDPSQGVIVVDADNNERTLACGEVIKIRPGMGFGKRVRWKRGGAMRDRIKDELALLICHYGNDVRYLDTNGEWFLIPRYPLPANCNQPAAQVCFSLRPGYPGIEPYGFYIAAGVTCDGNPVKGVAPPAPPPFPGNWYFLSWSPDGWVGTSDIVSGANLWGWARSFAARLREGP